MKIRRIHGIGVFMILLLLVMTLFPLQHLFSPGFPATDDGEWMIIRLSAFYQSLSEGQFPVRYLGRLNNGHGYPVANFLYPGFLYIGSILHLIGLSLADSVKAILGVSVVITAFASYALLRRETGRFAAFIGAMAAAYSPYLFFDVYKRGSVGEVLAIAMGTLAVWAVTSGRMFMAAGAFGALLISHNTVALLYALTIGIIVIRKRAYRMIGPLIMGAGMAAFFWIPAIVELRYVVFGSTPVSDPLDYMGRETLSLISLPTIVAAVGLMVLTSGSRRKRVFPMVVSYGLILFFATSLSMPFWGGVLGSMVQFPFRFHSLSVLLGSLIVGYFIHFLSKPLAYIAGFLIAVFLIIPLGARAENIRFEMKPDSYYATNESTTTVADEYMPRWVTEPPLAHPYQQIEVVEGDAVITMKRLGTQEMTAVIDARTKSMIEINKIYYPGWGITVDSIPVRILIADKTGQIRFMISEGVHEVHTEFHDTPLRFFSDIISVISFVLFLVFGIRIILGRKQTV